MAYPQDFKNKCLVDFISGKSCYQIVQENKEEYPRLNDAILCKWRAKGKWDEQRSLTRTRLQDLMYHEKMTEEEKIIADSTINITEEMQIVKMLWKVGAQAMTGRKERRLEDGSISPAIPALFPQDIGEAITLLRYANERQAKLRGEPDSFVKQEITFGWQDPEKMDLPENGCLMQLDRQVFIRNVLGFEETAGSIENA